MTTGLRIRPDDSVRRLDRGRVLIGGAPLRVLRLSETGALRVDEWLSGTPVGDDAGDRALAARLVRAGIAHPEYSPAPLGPDDVTVVVPVHDHAEELRCLLGSVGEVAKVIVVDDGSGTPLPGASVRHPRARGPAAARNTGWRLARTDLVAFLDADTVPEPGWLAPLLRQFADPQVAAVAPRVRSLPGAAALARYEHARSPLDVGGHPAVVRPGSRVSYVPGAALVVRAAALREHGGFDERMRFGQDVDFVWRLAAAGADVRFEPESMVGHAPRASWRRWLRQRFEYGTTAAPLALRHGSAVAPLRVSVWSALSWALAAAGHPGAGAGVAAVTAGLLPRKLSPAGVPAGESLRLAGLGHLGAGRLLADAVTRSWGPVALPALAATRRGRWVLTAAYSRYLADWHRDRPSLDPGRWVLARLADDLAYGAGVWWGCAKERTVRPLLPDLSDWPGRSGVESEVASVG